MQHITYLPTSRIELYENPAYLTRVNCAHASLLRYGWRAVMATLISCSFHTAEKTKG